MLIDDQEFPVVAALLHMGIVEDFKSLPMDVVDLGGFQHDPVRFCRDERRDFSFEFQNGRRVQCPGKRHEYFAELLGVWLGADFDIKFAHRWISRVLFRV